MLRHVSNISDLNVRGIMRIGYQPRHARAVTFLKTRIAVFALGLLGGFAGLGMALAAPAGASTVITYQDTSLLVVQPTNNAFVHRWAYGLGEGGCLTLNSGTQTLTAAGPAPAEGHSNAWSLSAVTGAPNLKISSTGVETAQITDGVNTDAAVATDVTATVSDGYGDTANAVVDLSVEAGTVGTIQIDSMNCIAIEAFPSEQTGGVQFDAADFSTSNGEENAGSPPGSDEPAETSIIAGPTSAAESFTWSAQQLPSGLSINPATGFIAPGTAAPGQYGVKVIATDASGAASVISFTLQVNATEIVTETGKTFTGTIVDFSHKCLDVAGVFGVDPAVSAPLQVWTCGAAGSEDQLFSYNTVAHTLVYDDKAAHDNFCVTSVAVGPRAVIEVCDGASDQTVEFHGGVYRFDSNGSVLDVSAFGKANGTPVLSYAFNGGKNQFWSLPV